MYIIKKATKQDIAYIIKDIKNQARREEATWEEVYDKIFSEKISQQIFEEFPDFHYSDPDTSYQEDVCAFVDAFCEYAGVEAW